LGFKFVHDGKYITAQMSNAAFSHFSVHLKLLLHTVCSNLRFIAEVTIK